MRKSYKPGTCGVCIVTTVLCYCMLTLGLMLNVQFTFLHFMFLFLEIVFAVARNPAYAEPT